MIEPTATFSFSYPRFSRTASRQSMPFLSRSSASCSHAELGVGENEDVLAPLDLPGDLVHRLGGEVLALGAHHAHRLEGQVQTGEGHLHRGDAGDQLGALGLQAHQGGIAGATG